MSESPTHRAEEKAREILLRHLNDEQRQSFETNLRFDIVASNGKTFTISYGTVYNIAGDDGNKYCVNAVDAEFMQGLGFLPTCDQLLAQKLLIETDVDRFYLFANKKPQVDPASGYTSMGVTLTPSDPNNDTVAVAYIPNNEWTTVTVSLTYVSFNDESS